MAAANDVYTTSFELNGKVSPDLLKGLEAIYKDLGKIVSQNKEVAKETKKAFEGFQKFLTATTAKAKDLTSSLKELMLPLLGISLAFKGFTTIGDTIQTAIDKYRNLRAEAANLRATLEGIAGPRRGAEIFEADEKQIARLKGMFDNIYGGTIFESVQAQMAEVGVSLKDQAMKGLVEAAAYASHTLKLTPELAGDFAEKVARSLIMPRLDPELTKFLMRFGISRKEFQRMSGTERLRTLLAAFKQQKYIEAQMREQPDVVQLMQAKLVGGAAMAQLGKIWEPLQTEGQIVSQDLANAFLEAFIPASEGLKGLLLGPMKELDKQVKKLGVELRRIFNPNPADIAAGYRKIGTWDDLGHNLKKAWDEDIYPQLKKDWDIFIKWAGEQWANWQRFAHEKTYAPGIGAIETHPFFARIDDFITGTFNLGVSISKFVGGLGSWTWTAMQSIWETTNKAIQDLTTAIRNFNLFGAKTVVPKTTEEGEQWQRDYDEYMKRTSPELKPGFGHQFGGIINAPQVGLIGEAGPESIIPLKQDANTLNLLGATLSQLQVNPMDPNAYGHELFDAMRNAPGGFGLGSGYAGPPGFSGYAGGVYYTEYGPAVPGDQPGGPTYDYNSYHRIGAWPGITGLLQPGDVALGYGAERFYGVSPGQTFVDTRGNTVRFADRSGSANPMNEDVFRMASGGIVSRRILSWLGEAGKEAVIPLSGNRGRSALQGALGGVSGHTFNFSPTINVSGVATDEVVDNLVAELRNNFSRWLDDAAFEHERRAFS